MRSDRIKKGVEAAPQRALLYALGLTDYEMEKPLIRNCKFTKRDCAGAYGSG